MKRSIYFLYRKHVKDVNRIDFKTFSYIIAQQANAKVYYDQTGVYWDKQIDPDIFNPTIERHKLRHWLQRAKIHFVARHNYPKIGA